MCSYNFSSVLVAEWPPFGEIAAGSVDHMFSFVFCLFVVTSHFGIESWIWVLVASVPDLCTLLTFIC